ncbi:MAG: AAA family ATPase [bacterium]|nr:AAA family ATPase [bacterium]
MIKQIKLIRNIGQFDSVQVSSAICLRRLTLVYAENARGKTTLCAIFRSLSSNEALPISERRRIGAQYYPDVVLKFENNNNDTVFQNGSWNLAYPNILVFDDLFVDQNVYSGLEVGPNHKQNLHELIIGIQGVSLARSMDLLANDISVLNTEIKAKANAIPIEARNELSVDDFCALPDRSDIDNAINVVQKKLDALSKAGEVLNTPLFEPFSLPTIDKAKIESILKRSLPELDGEVVTKLKHHFEKIGSNGEQWVSDGVNRVSSEESTCPFCGLNLSHSELYAHYKIYFSQAYSDLSNEINSVLLEITHSLGGDLLAQFLSKLQIQLDRHRFWSTLTNLPSFNVSVDDISCAWQEGREVTISALQSKKVSPLEPLVLNDNVINKIDVYIQLENEIFALSTSLCAINNSISRIKSDTASADPNVVTLELKRLKATKARYLPSNAPFCNAYIEAKTAKASKEAEKARVRQQLDQHRTTVFPAYQSAINHYLNLFGTSFTIQGVVPTNPSGRPSSNYHIVISNTQVNLSGASEAPCFKNTLSSGDRNSLALAFFFASLEQAPDLSNAIVVIDDPVSSLDDHRELSTAQEIRRLTQRASQVIVLSHDKTFLCRLWQYADRSNTATLEVTRSGVGSTLEVWNPSDNVITEYDRRHEILRLYRDNNSGNNRVVAESIRFVLEGFLRVARPSYFTSCMLLGEFRENCRQSLNQPNHILEQDDFDELCDLIEYANKFHHDTNPAWETVVINDGELLTFVRRTLNFVGKR